MGKTDNCSNQVLIKFQVQRNIIAIVKSVSPQRIKDNIKVISHLFRIVYSVCVCVCMHAQLSPFTTVLCQALDYQLSDDDMKTLMSCHSNWRGYTLTW